MSRSSSKQRGRVLVCNGQPSLEGAPKDARTGTLSPKPEAGSWASKASTQGLKGLPTCRRDQH